MSLEPFRIGMTVLMLNRPRPMLQLLAFLMGGFVMGTTVGALALFIFRPLLGSAHFTLPRVQIAIGVTALLIAAAVLVLAALGWKRPPERVVPARVKELLQGRSLWVAGVAGLGIALPSVDYLAALAIILASGAAPATQIGAVLMFNAVAFALVEIPLVAYLLAPNPTDRALSGLYSWLRARRPHQTAAIFAAVGGLLVVAGISGW